MAAPHNHHSLASGAFAANPGSLKASTTSARSAEFGDLSVRASSSPAYCPALDFNPPLPGPVMTFEQRRSGAKVCRSEKFSIRSVKRAPWKRRAGMCAAWFKQKREGGAGR